MRSRAASPSDRPRSTPAKGPALTTGVDGNTLRDTRRGDPFIGDLDAASHMKAFLVARGTPISAKLSADLNKLLTEFAAELDAYQEEVKTASKPTPWFSKGRWPGDEL